MMFTGWKGRYVTELVVISLSQSRSLAHFVNNRPITHLVGAARVERVSFVSLLPDMISRIILITVV